MSSNKNSQKLRIPYDFFVSERTAERLRQGLKVGYKKTDELELKSDWKNLPDAERQKYEDLARKAQKAKREADEARKKRRAAAEELEAKRQETIRAQRRNEGIAQDLLEFYSKDTEALDTRNFTAMKFNTMCKIRGENGDRDLYVPGELCIASFNLEQGMKKNYWTLIDPVTVPAGYGSEMTDNNKVTGLPLPGSKMFQPSHRDYKKILHNVRRFIETYLEPHQDNFAVFVMPDEIAAVQGSIDWLILNAFKDDPGSAERVEYMNFFEKVKLAKHTAFLAKLIVVAKARNPERKKYDPIFSNLHGLERWTEGILERKTYEFYKNLTCPYHNHDIAQDKMNTCCRNVVLRRIYLTLGHVIEDMDIVTSYLAGSLEPHRFGENIKQAPYVPGGGV